MFNNRNRHNLLCAESLHWIRLILSRAAKSETARGREKDGPPWGKEGGGEEGRGEDSEYLQAVHSTACSTSTASSPRIPFPVDPQKSEQMDTHRHTHTHTKTKWTNTKTLLKRQAHAVKP